MLSVCNGTKFDDDKTQDSLFVTESFCVNSDTTKDTSQFLSYPPISFAKNSSEPRKRKSLAQMLSPRVQQDL